MKLLLKPNSRVVFFGDSLTCRSGAVYGADLRKHFGENYIGSYVDILMKRILVNFPDANLLFWNKGSGGNDVPALLERVDRDVVALKPDTVVLWVGQNDAKGFSASEFERNLRKLTSLLYEAEIRLVHLSTTPFPNNAEKNKVLDSYDPIIRKVAGENGNLYVNLKERFNLVMASNVGSKNPIELFTSGPHLSELGNILVADAVFESLVN